MVWNALMRGVEWVAHRWMLVCAMLGMGLCYAPITYLYGFSSLDLGRSVVVNDVASAVAFLAVGLLAGRYGPLCRRGAALVLAPLLCPIGVLGFAVARSDLGLLMVNVVQSIGFVLLVLMWMEVIGCFKVTDAAKVVTGALIVHVVRNLAVQVGDAQLVLFVLVLSPLLSFALLVALLYKTRREPQPKNARGVGNLKVFLFWIAAYAVIWGSCRGDLGGGLPAVLVESLAGVMPALLLGAWAAATRRPINVRVMCFASAPFLVVALVLQSVAGPAEYLGAFLAHTGGEGCYLLTIVVACAVARVSDRSGALWGGLVFGTSCLGILVGTLVLELAAPAALAVVQGICLAVFVGTSWSLFVHGSVVFGASDVASVVREGSDEAARRQALVARAKEAHGLTDAESSLLLLLAAGMTREQIADELFIAPVTVRVHISRICKKMGVSGADGLVGALEGSCDGGKRFTSA